MRKIASGFVVLTVFALLVHTGCAPVIGTSQLVYRSAPEKPHWIRVIPQSRTYQYFVGISDNYPTLDEAKRHAILDALEEAVAQKGVEVSVKFQKLATEEQRYIRETVDLKGIYQLGLERVAWYYEEWEQYVRGGKRNFFRAFVLMRSRKLKPSNIFVAGFRALGQRLDAVWHSLLLPGWGQKRYGKKGKFLYFFYTTFLSGSAWLASSIHYENYQQKRSDLERELEQAVSEAEQRQILEDLNDLDRKIRDTKKIRKVASVLTMSFYTLNLLDALIFGPPSYRSYAGMRVEPKLMVSDPSQKPILGLSIIYHFPVDGGPF